MPERIKSGALWCWADGSNDWPHIEGITVEPISMSVADRVQVKVTDANATPVVSLCVGEYVKTVLPSSTKKKRQTITYKGPGDCWLWCNGSNWNITRQEDVRARAPTASWVRLQAPINSSQRHQEDCMGKYVLQEDEEQDGRPVYKLDASTGTGSATSERWLWFRNAAKAWRIGDGDMIGTKMCLMYCEVIDTDSST